MFRWTSADKKGSPCIIDSLENSDCRIVQLRSFYNIEDKVNDCKKLKIFSYSIVDSFEKAANLNIIRSNTNSRIRKMTLII